MNEKKFINLIIALIVVIVAVAGYIIFTRQASAPEKNTSDVVTVLGTIACLPKTGTGNQTMECAIGLKAADGKHYALKNLAKHDSGNKFSTTGLKVEVKGTLKTDDQSGSGASKYNITGTIDVTSIKEDKE